MKQCASGLTIVTNAGQVLETCELPLASSLELHTAPSIFSLGLLRRKIYNIVLIGDISKFASPCSCIVLYIQMIVKTVEESENTNLKA